MSRIRRRNPATSPAHARQRDETEAWKKVARETFHASDLLLTPALRRVSREEGARRALQHLATGRALMQPIIDRYVADARTPWGRAWRRRAVQRGKYVLAFDEAEAYARARAGLRTPTDEPDPPFPVLLTRDGNLWLIQRYTGDRRILTDDAPTDHSR